MQTRIEVSHIEHSICNSVNILISKIETENGELISEKVWGISFHKGDDLNAPLPCQWEGDDRITPVLLDDEIKATILAKWAEIK